MRVGEKRKRKKWSNRLANFSIPSVNPPNFGKQGIKKKTKLNGNLRVLWLQGRIQLKHFQQENFP